MKALYLALCKEVADEMGEDWFIDLWNGQTENPAKDYSLVPAVYIDIRQERRNNQVSQFKQLVTATVSIYIEQILYGDTHENSPDQSRTLECLNNTKRLYESFQGFAGNEHLTLRAPMQCIADGSEPNATNVWTYKQVYTCQYFDEGGKPL